MHDVGRHDGIPYVVTELLEGENFRELVSRRTPTVRQILGYTLQAARDRCHDAKAASPAKNVRNIPETKGTAGNIRSMAERCTT